MRYEALTAAVAALLLSGGVSFASDAISNTDANTPNSAASAASVCSDPGLSSADQTSCRSQMMNATTAAQRQQIANTYEARKTGSSSSYSTNRPTTDLPPSSSEPSSSDSSVLSTPSASPSTNDDLNTTTNGAVPPASTRPQF